MKTIRELWDLVVFLWQYEESEQTEPKRFAWMQENDR